MAVAAPTFGDKLGLAFLPGQLESLHQVAEQRISRVDEVITPRLVLLINPFGLVPLPQFGQQRQLWISIRDDSVPLAQIRNWVYGGAIVAVGLKKWFPVTSYVAGTVTALLGYVVYYHAAGMSERRHESETFLQQHLPEFFAE